MAAAKKPRRKKKDLLLGPKERWVSGCVAFLFLLLMGLIAVLLYALLFHRA